MLASRLAHVHQGDTERLDDPEEGSNMSSKTISYDIDKERREVSELLSKNGDLSDSGQSAGSVIESKCSECGTEYFIAHNAGRIRKDGKVIWAKGSKDYHACVYRCEGCGNCVHKTVKGAEFE